MGVAQDEYDHGIDIREFLPLDGNDHPEGDISLMAAKGPAEYRLRRKDGSTIMVIADAAIMPEAAEANAGKEESVRFLVNLTDITQIKKLEFQLNQAQKMEAIGRLAGGIAHDFNNILYIILGYSELLMGNMAKNHPHYEGLKEIFTASDRARLLVKQLMAFGRKQVLNINWVDINQVIRDFEKLLGRVIGEDIELKIHLMKHPGIVKADVTQIEQILMNLVVNARDAMPDGGTLTIETAKVELDGQFAKDRSDFSPGNYVMIVVGDTGSGMDRKTIEKIFEPFFTTKSNEAGTGLGLSTVYGIVKQHEGHIDVYSEPGQGSVFKIYIPSFTDEVCIVEAEPVLQAGTMDVSATVMVVEDDPSVRRMTGKILVEKGYTVIEALNTDDAVRQAKHFKGRLNLLLTDVIMPGMKGPEVHQRILEYHPETKALYMSGYTADVITRHGVLKEGLQFIQKPFSAKTLLAKVEQLISESPRREVKEF
jgi:two-component system, cell cycle sensor histidine kinase and response regulator CckA